MNKPKFVVLEKTYGSIDEEMGDERYEFENVYADHFTTMTEAEEAARTANLERSYGGRYSYRAVQR